MGLSSLCGGIEDSGLCEGIEDSGLCGGIEDSGLCGGIEDSGLCGGIEDSGLCGGIEDSGLYGGIVYVYTVVDKDILNSYTRAHTRYVGRFQMSSVTLNAEEVRGHLVI